MGLDTFLGIACLTGAVICWIGYRWASANVRLKYHDQKVVVKK